MSEERKIDPRMQVIIDMIPAETPLFRVTYSDRLFWKPQCVGYVSEYNPFWAGLYEPTSDYTEWQTDNRHSEHSHTVDARTRLSTISVPDGCLMAMLVDEVTSLREALALETGALGRAAADAEEQKAEADRWRERAETFERRMKAAVERLREHKETQLTARDRPDRRDDSRRRWGHERAALAYGYAADMIEHALTSDGEP